QRRKGACRVAPPADESRRVPAGLPRPGRAGPLPTRAAVGAGQPGQAEDVPRPARPGAGDSAMASPAREPDLILRLRPLKSGVPRAVRQRRGLKYWLRACAYRCVSVGEAPPDGPEPAQAPPDTSETNVAHGRTIRE